MEDEILEAERQRNEIIKRIQEKERLINLIQSRHLKEVLQEIKEFQNKYNLQQEQQDQQKEPIQDNIKKSISQKQSQVQNIPFEESKETNEKELANIKFNSFQQGVNYISMIKRLQRAYRKMILKRNKKRLRNYYLNKLIKEFYRPISFERGVELRKMLIERLKQWKAPEEDYEIIVNKYFEEYKNFCFNFPYTEKIREDNFFIYYQSLDLLNYMESINQETALNECNQFKNFMLDKNKEFSTKLLLDEMEKQYKYKNDIHEYNTIDEFE